MSGNMKSQALGAELYQIKGMLGHRSIETTEGYVELVERARKNPGMMIPTCGFCTGRAVLMSTICPRGFWYPDNLELERGGYLQTYDEWMADMASRGVNLVTARLTGRNQTAGSRFFAGFEPPPPGTFNIWHSRCNPDDLAQYRADQVTHPIPQSKLEASNLYKFLNAAEKHGIYVWVTLFERAELTHHWERHPYNAQNKYVNGVRCQLQDRGWVDAPTDIFSDSRAIEAAKARIQFVMDAFGACEQIVAWELFREMFYVLTQAWPYKLHDSKTLELCRQVLMPWVREVAAYTKAADPLHRPVTISNVRAPIGRSWDEVPEYWHVINDVFAVPEIDFVTGRGYFKGDFGLAIREIRLLQEKFQRPVVLGEYHPFDGRSLPVNEPSPFLGSKEMQWLARCSGALALRFQGLRKIRQGVWETGGYADPDMHHIAAITRHFDQAVGQDLADVVNWDENVASAGASHIISHGDSRHVAMMIRWNTSGNHDVTVSALDDGDYTLMLFDWVTGELEETRSLTASGGSAHFAYDVQSERNTMVAYLAADEEPPDKPPTASFVYTAADLSCDFDGSGSTDPDGTIVTYDWDFGDGSLHGSGVTASHTYATAGIYTVVLTVTDDDGITATDRQNVAVSESGGCGELLARLLRWFRSLDS